jgi:hypothetical protein
MCIHIHTQKYIYLGMLSIYQAQENNEIHTQVSQSGWLSKSAVLANVEQYNHIVLARKTYSHLLVHKQLTGTTDSNW